MVPAHFNKAVTAVESKVLLKQRDDATFTFQNTGGKDAFISFDHQVWFTLKTTAVQKISGRAEAVWLKCGGTDTTNVEILVGSLGA